MENQEEEQYQDFINKTREAIDASGGCSTCGDLDGYGCVCDDEEEGEIFGYECAGCGRTSDEKGLGGTCPRCSSNALEPMYF